MKKIYSLTVLAFLGCSTVAQICNPTGNLIIFSNYDGGTLNINLDAPMADIKIGVVSYEGVTINITGMGASSVTGVAYAGYNGNNPACGSAINTTITGAPGSATTNISLYPAATLSNSNGYGSIVCAYSCSNSTYQGGCNTVDQVEAYFLDYFPGSTLFSHKVQYGCWSGTQNVSAGGNCCPVTTGITQIDRNAFTIYPNPASGELSISALNGYNTASFRIFSAEGKLIKERAALGETIDISELQAGFYFIEINDSGSFSRIRFVKN